MQTRIPNTQNNQGIGTKMASFISSMLKEANNYQKRNDGEAAQTTSMPLNWMSSLESFSQHPACLISTDIENCMLLTTGMFKFIDSCRSMWTSSSFLESTVDYVMEAARCRYLASVDFHRILEGWHLSSLIVIVDASKSASIEVHRNRHLQRSIAVCVPGGLSCSASPEVHHLRHRRRSIAVGIYGGRSSSVSN